MPEIAEAACLHKACQVLLVAQVDCIQAERRARRQQVGNGSVLFIAHRQHRHLDRHDTPLAVVVHDLVADVIGGHQLAHQPIVVDVNVVDQSVDLITISEWSPDECAKSRRILIQLRDAAADDKTGCPSAQQASDFDWISHITSQNYL